ncbi:RNA polymerase sigma factor [Paremcibacter congregatus]|uniref:RNA polymerase subunit sigma-70 n=1 Tax=Paremcibacter congregatus TaxID=2043170 RepID=A0A2G4YQY1_9PROT|nr:RNA polymerase sigma factor [Paremcibacter congregatus]PHZ84729.1 hypothetical protein CRD36_10615 [Paremcibacter congregatus]QDE28924.1 RNA polymerase sigma factor [Paremcibacter congregatus]
MSKIENKAFVNRLYRRYERNIRKFLMRKGQQAEDVEDIVQETFLKAHKVSNWQQVVNPESFLVSIARNAYKDHVRKEMRTISGAGIDPENVVVESDLLSPERFAAGRQDIQELEKIIYEMAPRVKQAFILIKIMHVSYRDAATIMNVSTRTVENHITKGMAECRKKMVLVQDDVGFRDTTGQVISLSDHKALLGKKGK